MSEEIKTIFKQKSDAYQNSQCLTKVAAITTGLGLVGTGIVLLIGSIIAYNLSRSNDFLFGLSIIGIAISAIIIIIGISKTIVNSARQTKSVTCPSCNTKHDLFLQVSKFMCTNCRTLLILGHDIESLPHFQACSYCGLHTATTIDHDSFSCPNCGIIRGSTSNEVLSKTQICPGCNQIIPDGVIYCISCRFILKSDFSLLAQGDITTAYDQYWMIGKDANGHLIFAKAILQGIREDILMKHAEKVDVAKIHSLLINLENAIISIEESIREPEHRSSIEALLPDLDLIYAGVLELELYCLKDIKSKWLAKKSLDIFANEPHIAARRRIEDFLGSSLDSTGSIGIWNEKLVEIRTIQNNSVVYSVEGLENELGRFVFWKINYNHI